MDLQQYVMSLQEQLHTASAAGGEPARELAARLTAPLETATRLVLLEALAAAASEITRELAPGSVDVRLRGRDPEFVVTPRPTSTDFDDGADSFPVNPPPAQDGAPRARPPGSPCGCPSRSRCASRKQPPGTKSLSTPGSSAPSPLRWTAPATDEPSRAEPRPADAPSPAGSASTPTRNPHQGTD